MGGAYGDLVTGGNWTSEESECHINFLELQAAWFVLRSFTSEVRGKHIRINVDNTTTLAYINNMGGKIRKYNELTRKIWLWCRERGNWLSAAYIPSAMNVEADT